MRICTRCVLPETFPGIRFDDNGVCSFCARHTPYLEGLEAKQAIREKFEKVAREVRSRPGYHAALAYSGGKDSTYTLWLLRSHYDLRVLTVTFDNGFISPCAFANIRAMSEAMNADSLVIKPRRDALVRVFSEVTRRNPYPAKALERASGICNACMGLVKNVVLRVALEKGIPLVVYGWSPGQAPISASLFRMNAPMLRQMVGARSTPLATLAGDALEPYLLAEEQFAQAAELPFNVNLLAFHDYVEEDVRSAIERLGWSAPDDTDGNSTNCLLNSFATRHHLARYGYHPYAFEVAGLVRSGAMTRDQGLASLADLGSEPMAARIGELLGFSEPGTSETPSGGGAP